ncbi:MAG: alpha/beta hydrolase [Burkholderiales bacterium]|nr:alpha/beta hydrolase [Burkholderiales bacterium]
MMPVCVSNSSLPALRMSDHFAEHCFQYFPGDHMWSHGLMVGSEMQTWGAAALGEVDQIGRRLKGREGDNDAWFTEWRAMAERMQESADAHASAGRELTAGTYYLHAATYYFVADRYCKLGDAKIDTYRRCARCFSEGVKRRWKNIERVEVPYEGKSLPAYFVKSPCASGRAPTAVMFDGLDSAKEINTLFAGVEIANRGIHCIVIDGPGQGESLRLRNIYTRHDYEVAGTCAYDFVTSRPDVDPSRVAVGGLSMGGYYAPRIAAFEKRYAACVAWGAHFDYYGVWLKRRKVLESGGTRLSAPGFQLPWVLGVADMDAAMEKLKRFTLEGVAQNITCALLVVHGERDSIVPVEMAHRLHDTASSRIKTLKIFTAEEGGSEHCQGDNRQIGANYVADWLAANL